jgi:hypothetical protein
MCCLGHLSRTKPGRRRVMSGRSGTLASAILAISAALTVPAAPAAADRCADGYHDALQKVRDGRGSGLGPTNRSLRAADPDMSGTWLYAAQLFPRKGKNAPKPERVCAEEVKKGGRARCSRWEEKPLDFGPTIATLPTDDEIVVFKFLDEYVRAKGAPSEFGANGRYNWLVARVIGDLRGYITQLPNPALCAGGPDLMDFYANELKTMRRRTEEVQEIDENARDFAVRRIEQAELLVKEGARTTPPIVGGPAIAGTPAAMTPVPRQSMQNTSPSPRYEDLIHRVMQLVLSRDQVALVMSEISLVASLRQARMQLESDTAKEAALELREGVMVALRAIEAGVYATALQARYASIEASVHGTIGDVREAHAAQCTCGN